MELKLPKINKTKIASKYRVDWDSQGTEAEKVLFESYDLLTGYIEGYIDALQSDAKIICLAVNTGTVDSLTNESAEKLVVMLEQLLYPRVKHRFEQIKKFNNLPHVKLKRETD